MQTVWNVYLQSYESSFEFLMKTFSACTNTQHTSSWLFHVLKQTILGPNYKNKWLRDHRQNQYQPLFSFLANHKMLCNVHVPVLGNEINLETHPHSHVSTPVSVSCMIKQGGLICSGNGSLFRLIPHPTIDISVWCACLWFNRKDVWAGH